MWGVGRKRVTGVCRWEKTRPRCQYVGYVRPESKGIGGRPPHTQGQPLGHSAPHSLVGLTALKLCGHLDSSERRPKPSSLFKPGGGSVGCGARGRQLRARKGGPPPPKQDRAERRWPGTERSPVSHPSSSATHTHGAHPPARGGTQGCVQHWRRRRSCPPEGPEGSRDGGSEVKFR